MRGITMTAAALMLATAFASAPANAETTSWGPVRDGNMCYKNSMGWAGQFGYWEQCPGAAKAAHGGMLHHPLRPRRDPHNDR
jgi:hypothetical protein